MSYVRVQARKRKKCFGEVEIIGREQYLGSADALIETFRAVGSGGWDDNGAVAAVKQGGN